MRLQACCERDNAVADKDVIIEEKNSTTQQKEKLLSELQQVSAQAAEYKKQLSKVLNIPTIFLEINRRYLSICDMKSVTAYVGRIANQRKIPKWLPFKNYKSESLNI